MGLYLTGIEGERKTINRNVGTTEKRLDRKVDEADTHEDDDSSVNCSFKNRMWGRAILGGGHDISNITFGRPA